MSDEWTQLLETAEAARRMVARIAAELRSSDSGGMNQRPPVIQGNSKMLDTLVSALDAFPNLVGYINGRRSAAALATIDSEAAVQDLLYVSLKPIFGDLFYEQPTEKGTAGYSVGDFSIPSMKLILEAKYVGQRSHVKARADEISQDIWKYSTQTDSEVLVFFVFDPNLLIPDRANFARMSSATAGEFKAKGREVEIVTVVKP